MPLNEFQIFRILLDGQGNVYINLFCDFPHCQERKAKCGISISSKHESFFLFYNWSLLGFKSLFAFSENLSVLETIINLSVLKYFEQVSIVVQYF
jgi:hypothetical protein